MTIQFVCTECGQWMELPEDSIGLTAACPQCGKNLPVPEESDRLLTEGACFYCGEAIELTDLPDPGEEIAGHEPPTCAACRESIDENDYELELERQRMGSAMSTMFLILYLAGAFALVGLLVFLLISVVERIRSNGQAPHEPSPQVFALACELPATPSAWLPALSAPTRAE